MWHYNCEPSDRKGDAIICSEREVMCIRCGRRGCSIATTGNPKPQLHIQMSEEGRHSCKPGGKGVNGMEEVFKSCCFCFLFFSPFPYHGNNIVTRTVFAYRVTTSNSQKWERVNNILAGWGHKDWTISNLDSKTQSSNGLIFPQKYKEENHGLQNLWLVHPIRLHFSAQT